MNMKWLPAWWNRREATGMPRGMSMLFSEVFFLFHREQIWASFFNDTDLPSISLMAAAAAINDKCVRP